MQKKIFDQFMGIDYLVYSSHKTGTQTITNSLNGSGVPAKHCHLLSHTGLADDQLLPLLEAYYEKHRRKLKLVSVFREPIARHISSFFQGYGTKPLRQGLVKSVEETLIYKLPIEKLQTLFVDEIDHATVIGWPESLHNIFQGLSITAENLTLAGNGWLHYSSALVDLSVQSFEWLFADFEKNISSLVGVEVVAHNSNIGSEKWYQEIYRDFKLSLKLPRQTIAYSYRYREDLVRLLNDDYAGPLAKACERWGLPS